MSEERRKKQKKHSKGKKLLVRDKLRYIALLTFGVSAPQRVLTRWGAFYKHQNY